MQLGRTVADLPPGREDKLERVRQIRRAQDALQEEYEDLRDELRPELKDAGLVYFVGADGQKYRQTWQETEQAVWNLELMEAELPPEVFEEVTVRKVNGDAFKRAKQAGRITEAQMLRYLDFVPKASYPKIEPADKPPYEG